MTVKAQFPVDANFKPYTGSMVGLPIAATYNGSISSAASVNLNALTTWIEITAFTAGVLVRYAAGAATNAFDEVVPANTTRGFARPDGVTVVSVIQQAATAAVAVIEK